MMPSNSLEQEAMDRVRKMYASFDRHPAHSPAPPAEPKNAHADAASKKPDPVPEASQKPKGLLDVLMKDQDQSLILLLLVLLMKDGADMNLMLALMYLLL